MADTCGLPLLGHNAIHSQSMRRRHPPSADSWAEFVQLMAAGDGLRLLLARLPAGATLADARRLREQIMRVGREPSRCLERDPVTHD